MKSHRGVRHDRFRPRCCDFKEPPWFLHDFVANKIKISFLWFVNDFLVRERSLRSWIPVDHPTPAVDQIFVIKIDKNFLNSPNVGIIQRVPLTRPVA